MAKTDQMMDERRSGADAAIGGGGFSASDAALYVAHIERGETIRSLAAATGTHPSTISRTIRRVEDRRDDPLYDRVLRSVEARTDEVDGDKAEDAPIAMRVGATPPVFDDETIMREARKFLRRLAEPDSFLLVAEGTEKAGIFCATNAHRKPIATMPVAIAAEFLRRDWIRAMTRGRVSVRYRLSDVGRSCLRRLLAEDGEERRRRTGFAEAPTPFQFQHRIAGERVFLDPASGEPECVEVNLGESPIGWLARRKGPDGQAFLTPVEVEASERLRSDFEMAQMGPSVAQDWRKFLTPGDRLAGNPVPRGPGEGPMLARDRVMAALDNLGPGLSDVAIRVCCFLEGLEACERRMGWSARSGKVVLKIALQRLADHYGIADFRH